MIKFGQKIRTTDSNVNYFVTSDLHFYHRGILNFCKDTRPYNDVDEMNEGLIEHWNSLVGVNDEVLHLGDFSFKGKEATQEILDQLNGNITFVLGNHCKVFRDSLPIKSVDYLEFRFNGTKVCAFHFPISSWNQQGRGSVHLYGHTHGSFQGEGRCVDVGFDNWGKIIPLQEAIDFCLEREIYCPDHHKITKEEV